MADYLNTSQYWGGSYWAGSYWGNLVLVPFDFAEIWDGQVRLNRIVAGSVRLNRIVAGQVVINTEVTDSYSELEAI